MLAIPGFGPKKLETYGEDIIRIARPYAAQDKAVDTVQFFDDITKALVGTHEVLLTGPGLARNQFREWCQAHRPQTATLIVDSIPADHPSDAQLVALAKQYFKKYDRLAADPSQA